MITIRLATLSDLNHIASLHVQSWRDNYQEALSQEYLEQHVETERKAVWSERLTVPKSNQLVLVAEGDMGFCGFICVFGAHHPNYGTIIDNLHVNPAVKGQGIGTKLLRAAAKWASENYQQFPMYLEVLACNPKAIGFYQALGGRQVDSAYWHTPCGNKVEEYLYFWDEPTKLAHHTDC